MLFLSVLGLASVMQIFAVPQNFLTKLSNTAGCASLIEPCTDGKSLCCGVSTFRNCVGNTVEQGDCRDFGFNKCVDGEGIDAGTAHCEQ